LADLFEFEQDTAAKYRELGRHRMLSPERAKVLMVHASANERARALLESRHVRSGLDALAIALLRKQWLSSQHSERVYSEARKEDRHSA